MEDCVFCKIAAGEVPAQIVHQDDKHMAFLDINPVSEGHTLVIPKKHYRNIVEMPPEEVADLARFLVEATKIVAQKYAVDDVNILSNIGRHAGQIIMHTHIHIIPRREGDGIRLFQKEGA